MLYTNMDRELIRHGGRKAPTCSIGDLMHIMDATIPEARVDHFYLHGCPANLLDADHPSFQHYLENRLIAMVFYRDEKPFAKLFKDLDKVCFGFDNPAKQSFGITSTGIPYLYCEFIGDDFYAPTAFFIYFDGKDLRGYVPVYGNSFNRFSKCAFGAMDEYEFGTKFDFIDESGAHTTISVDTYEDYESIPFDELEPNKDACLEAFTARVTASGVLMDDQINAICDKAMKERK